MIISESKKFIFLHNPKCAGTTVRKSLKKYDSRNDYYWLFDEVDGVKVDKAHMPLNIFRRYADSDFKLLSDYFVFGFVRNPFERVVSAFNEGHIQLFRAMKRGEVELSEYKSKLNEFCNGLTKGNTLGWNIQYRHCIQQHTIFFLENKRRADVIIKLEELNVSLDKVIAFLPELADEVSSWKQKKEGKNIKKVGIKTIDLLNEQSIERIKRVYEMDFILFDYEMELS